MKDAWIIDLIKHGHYEKASDKLYRYFRVVEKLVTKNSGSKQDAEDIYQEALIILIKKIQGSDFVLSSSLNTYLYSICRFLWSDHLKKQNRSGDLLTKKNDLAYVEIDPGSIHKEETDTVLAEKAFRQLGEKCRQLLLLFYFKKQTMKDIAHKLNFSSEKVAKNQKYRCMEKAKGYLHILKNSGHE